VTKQRAYTVLTKANVFWDRRDKNTIVVFTDGYLSAEAYKIEEFLKQAKFQCIEMSYDGQCGKTKSVYKHK